MLKVIQLFADSVRFDSNESENGKKIFKIINNKQIERGTHNTRVAFRHFVRIFFPSFSSIVLNRLCVPRNCICDVIAANRVFLGHNLPSQHSHVAQVTQNHNIDQCKVDDILKSIEQLNQPTHTQMTCQTENVSTCSLLRNQQPSYFRFLSSETITNRICTEQHDYQANYSDHNEL